MNASASRGRAKPRNATGETHELPGVVDPAAKTSNRPSALPLDDPE
jgi:hypothetical protein